MARQPRFQYPGAVYHVMARGNGGDAVFVNDDDPDSVSRSVSEGRVRKNLRKCIKEAERMLIRVL